MNLLQAVPAWMRPLRELHREAIGIENAVWFDLRSEYEDWVYYQPDLMDPEEEPLEPFMCYGWPLPWFHDVGERMNQLLVDAHSNVMVCERQIQDEDDGHYLMLTGGGMDLSWDIAFGYMACGFLPPAVFRLPEFAGLPASRRNQWISRGLTMSQRMHGVNASIVRRTAQVLKGAVPPARRRRARHGG